MRFAQSSEDAPAAGKADTKKPIRQAGSPDPGSAAAIWPNIEMRGYPGGCKTPPEHATARISPESPPAVVENSVREYIVSVNAPTQHGINHMCPFGPFSVFMTPMPSTAVLLVSRSLELVVVSVSSMRSVGSLLLGLLGFVSSWVCIKEDVEGGNQKFFFKRKMVSANHLSSFSYILHSPSAKSARFYWIRASRYCSLNNN
jgi:hypothetical protein